MAAYTEKYVLQLELCMPILHREVCSYCSWSCMCQPYIEKYVLQMEQYMPTLHRGCIAVEAVYANPIYRRLYCG